MDTTPPPAEDKTPNLNRAQRRIDEGHRRGKNSRWLPPDKTGKLSKNQYEDQLRQIEADIQANRHTTAPPSPRPPLRLIDRISLLFSPRLRRQLQETQEQERQWQQSEDSRKQNLESLEQSAENILHELIEIERLKTEEAANYKPRKPKPASPTRRLSPKIQAEREAEEARRRELIEYIEDRLPEDANEREKKIEIALEAAQAGADRYRIRFHLPVVRSTDDLMLHYLLRERLPVGIKWVIPSELMQEEIEAFGEPTRRDFDRIQTHLRDKYREQGHRFQTVHDLIKKTIEQFEQSLLPHLRGTWTAEEIQNRRFWIPVDASRMGKLIAEWDRRHEHALYHAWSHRPARGNSGGHPLTRQEIYEFLHEHVDEINRIHEEATSMVKEPGESNADFYHDLLSPASQRSEPRVIEPSEKHARFPWELTPVPEDFNHMLEENVQKFLEVTRDVAETVRNVKGLVPTETETIAAGSNRIQREFIDLKKVKQTLDESQQPDLLAPLLRWTRTPHGIHFPVGPDIAVRVDVNSHLFKSVQTHPELRNEQFVREMFLTLCGYPSNAVEHVIDAGRDRHIVFQREINPIQYHPQAALEKQEFIHVRLITEDEHGNRQPASAATDEPLRLRLVTAYSTPQPLTYTGSKSVGNALAERLRAGHLRREN